MDIDFNGLIDEFISSPNFLFLSGALKENAAALVASFTHACSLRGAATPEQLTITIFEDVLLNHIAQLDVPLSVRREAPELLSAFFDYLAQSGHYPPAAEWMGWIKQLDVNYQSKFRDDGSVKGETFRKKYTDVNRNDPCPCGSGKKFKKCCMGLLG
jgi:hypothetical protein